MLDDNEVLTAVHGLGCILLNLILEGTVRVHSLRLFDCKVLTEYPDCNRVWLAFCGTGDEDLVTLCYR